MTQIDFPYESLATRSFSLASKTALVTGGGGHLGTAIARGLATAGADVILVGRNEARLTAVTEAIRAEGKSADYRIVDLTDTAALARFSADFTDESTGRAVDILVNNAYSGSPNTLQNSRPEQFRDAYHIAVTVAAELVRGLLPAFRRAVAARGDATVINIASMYGQVSPDPTIYGHSGQNNPPYYGAAKAALIQYTRYAAVHLAPERIRVNAISPGPFPPPKLREESPTFYQELIRKVPMRRIGVADDLVGPVVFLASPSAQYVTGINLPVDGGWTSW